MEPLTPLSCDCSRYYGGQEETRGQRRKARAGQITCQGPKDKGRAEDVPVGRSKAEERLQDLARWGSLLLQHGSGHRDPNGSK